MMVKRGSFLRLNFEQIELQAKLLNYFLGSNKSNINQFVNLHQPAAEAKRRYSSQRDHQEDAYAASESFVFDSDLLVVKKTEKIETISSNRF